MDQISEQRIVQAIREAEHKTSGEIRVHVRKTCKQDALVEAQKIFKKLGMHKTKERNGVLIFVAPQSRVFAIVGDEGIHAKVGVDFWDKTRDIMSNYFKSDKIAEGIVEGVLSAGRELAKHFPLKSDNPNELSDQVTKD